eukprot:TRINITY_DN4698_c0_g2_i3.p1 TRINITY_DN4698_c0_g2~~TRINITY_DN4698_c0_g2_i3.p1  ORF type:complete len:240 (+),score=41.07 TRINITY_DN4698_c0_g2_i3:322-1041(+)
MNETSTITLLIDESESTTPNWVVILLVVFLGVGVILLAIYVKWWWFSRSVGGKEQSGGRQAPREMENPMMQLNDTGNVEMSGWGVQQDGDGLVGSQIIPNSSIDPREEIGPQQSEDYLQWLAFEKGLEHVREGKVVEASQEFNEARSRPPKDPSGESTAVLKIVEMTDFTTSQAAHLLKQAQQSALRAASGWPRDWGLSSFNTPYSNEKKPKNNLYAPIERKSDQPPPPLSKQGGGVII